jgi:hypothetical protein
MGAATYRRYQQIHTDRMRTLLLAWLGRLPPSGWKGSAYELHDCLAGVKVPAQPYISDGSGLTKQVMQFADLIRDAGWEVSFGRSNKGRWVRFLPRPASDVSKSV